MPRSVSGNYTLPLPPVVPNTTIEAVWANTTEDDIAQALTDSLDRYGRGGMVAPFRVPDGTEALPSLSFSSSTGSGMWVDPTSLNFSFQGDLKMEITAAGVTFTSGVNTIAFPPGTIAAPGLSVRGDSNTGFASIAANTLQFVTAGAIRGEFDENPGFYVGDSDLDPGASTVGLYNRPRLSSSSTTQYGQLNDVMFSTNATNAAYGIFLSDRFAAGAYNTAIYAGFRATPPMLGAGQTLTTFRGLQLDDSSIATNNYGIFSTVAAGTNKRFIESVGDAVSYFEGAIGIGVDPPHSSVRLQVRNTTPAASPAFSANDTIVAQSATNASFTAHAGAVGGTLALNFAVGAVRQQGAITYTPGTDIMIFKLGTVDKVVFGSAPIVGIIDGTLTGQTALTTADSLVIDGTGSTGISFLGGTTTNQRIAFGDTADNDVGIITYVHNGDFMHFTVGTLNLLQLGDPNVTIRTDGTVSGQTATSAADGLVIDSSSNAGLSILGPTNAIQALRFGDTANNSIGALRYDHGADELSLIAAAGTKLVAKSTGVDITGVLDVSGNVVVGGALSVPGSVATSGSVAQSTYTPTGTVGTNVTSLTVGTAFWIRVGDVVSVWGRVTPTFTAGDAPSSFDLSLPIASALTSLDQLAGTFAPHTALDHNKAIFGSIFGNATNDRATFVIRSYVAGAQACSYSYGYRVL